MHYRHIFHAGNFADVFKHALLVCLLRALNSKEKPWCYVDSHAGAGIYDLTDEGARRTGEWNDGVARVLELANAPEPLNAYLDLLRLAQVAGAAPRYPGSPWFAQKLARRGDRLILCESQPAIAELLWRSVGGPDVAIHRRDGYEAAALLPPPEKRGLLLVDPPFERVDEFDAVADMLARARQRFAGGIYAAWYPLKNPRAADRFVRRASQGVEALDLRIETGAPATPMPVSNAAIGSGPVAFKKPMTACGLLVLNPPFRFDEQARLVLDALLPALSRGPGAAVDIVPLPTSR